jgi:hypothetical protein
VRVSRRLAVVTVTVQQLEVGVYICSPTTSGENVIDFHPIPVRKEQSTRWALAPLSLQEPRDSERDFRMPP